MNSSKKSVVDWVIHYVANGDCNACGYKEEGFLPYACNAHTHGLEEKYGHPDFQLVLDLPVTEIGRILNSLGLRVQHGETFKAGDMVSGIYEDCEVRLDEVEETGRKVLRVVIPDQLNRFPDDPKCEEPYPIQLLETDALYSRSGRGGTGNVTV